MHFRISLIKAIEEKIDRLVDLTNTGSPLQAFWNDLAKVLKGLTERPMEMGEEVFDYKHGKYQGKLLVANNIAVQFAVNEEHHSVVVQRLTISGISPYPPEIEDVLNQLP